MGGAITKLKIGTYKDSSYKEKISENAFSVFINPSSFSLTRKLEFNSEQSSGTSESDLKYVKTLPTDLQLEFLFDGTGVTQANSGNALVNKIKAKLGKANAFAKEAVLDQVASFYKATCEYNGNIHKPYNVIVNWGEFEYKGVLSEFTIDYKMFNNDGTPLRAIGKATFKGAISQELAAARIKKSSPDLTHKRTVKDGDTLPLMTESIYGDSKYYLEVAKVNNLINFRQLTPGLELFFPPIEKVS